MADDTKQDQAPEEQAPVAPLPGNCKGNLKQFPAEPERAYNRYECQSCGQIVTVSHEDLELSGLPPEHSPTPTGE